jgi:hypothetical protein
MTAHHRSAEPTRLKIVQINSEVKALATGDPRILEKARIDAEMTRLERLERSHSRNQRVLSGTITKAETDQPKLAAERQAVEEAITRGVDTSGDRFIMTVNGTRWSARADAAIALRNALVTMQPVGEHGYDKPVHVATVAGFDVIATARRYLEPHLTLELDGVPRSSVRVDYDELRSDRPLGIVVKLENRAADLERRAARAHHRNRDRRRRRHRPGHHRERAPGRPPGAQPRLPRRRRRPRPPLPRPHARRRPRPDTPSGPATTRAEPEPARSPSRPAALKPANFQHEAAQSPSARKLLGQKWH